jgi:thiol-disulfide isomerase/thioredoxin
VRLLIFFFILAFTVGTGRAQTQTPFSIKSFDQAVTKAGKEKKLVLIDFFTTWCGPCKAMDRQTWTNTKVRTWLAEKTVAIKLDAEKEIDLAQKYNINAYPTILLLKPDGTEVDRLIGFRGPADFLAEAGDAVAGRDSVARARAKLAGEGTNDPVARMEYARALLQKGMRKEALDEYLWCFDHGVEHEPGFVGVRLSFLLGDIVDLGHVYAPALDALRQRRDAAEKAVLAATTDLDVVSTFSAINRDLGEEARTLAAYDGLGKADARGTRTRQILFDHVIDALLSAKRYEDVATGAGDLSKRIDEQIREFEMMKRELAGSPNENEIVPFLKGIQAGKGAKYYEVMIGVGQLEQGAAAANQLIAFEGTGTTYAALIKSAARAGKPDIAKALVAKALASLPESERGAVREAAETLKAGR